MHHSLWITNGKATVVCDGYTERPSTKDNVHQRRCPQVTNKVDISIATQFVGKKDCLANNIHKQALIKLIANCMQQKGCHVIHAEGDADVDIAKADVPLHHHIAPLHSSERTRSFWDYYFIIMKN